MRGENRILKECDDLGGELCYRLSLDLDGYYERNRPPFYNADWGESDQLKNKARRLWIREKLKRRFSPGMIRRWESKEGDIDATVLALHGKLNAVHWVLGQDWDKADFIGPLVEFPEA